MKKYNKLSIISLIMLIMPIIVVIVTPDKYTIPAYIVIILILVITIVLGFISKFKIKKEQSRGKVLSLIAIIVGFIMLFYAGLSLAGFMAMNNIDFNDAVICNQDKMVKDCIDNGDGTSTCKYEGIDIPCSTNLLKDNQIKK